jgi:site-specific DNA-adenine methylase
MKLGGGSVYIWKDLKGKTGGWRENVTEKIICIYDILRE